MKRTVLSAAVLAALTASLGAQAQTTDTPAAPRTEQEKAQSAESSSTAQTIERVTISGRFLAQGAKSATKLDATVLDTPFNVEGYSGSFMKAIETATVSDLYNYMNGVKKAGNTGYDLTMRGFQSSGTDRSAIMVDGLPGLTGRFGSPPTIGVERIEVVKGPMSLLYGQIQPGGFVNIVSKKPSGRQFGSIDIKGTTYAGSAANFGDHNGINVAGDVTGPIGDGKTLQYRVVGEISDKKGFRTGTFEKGNYFAPSLRWEISEDDKLTMQAEHRHTESSFDIGLAAYGRDITKVAPITTRYQQPSDFRKETGDTFSFAYEHSINDDWTWNTGARHVKNRSNQEEFSTIGFRNATTATRRARMLEINRTYQFIDSNVVGEFSTGPFKHKLVFGANGGKDTDDENRTKFYNSGACPGPTCLDISLYNPVYTNTPDIHSLPDYLPGQANLLTDAYFETHSYGIYASDLITLAKQWKLSVGMRKAHEKQVIYDKRILTVPTTVKITDKSPLAATGLLFQPDKQWTIYASYASSFVPAPANSQDTTGKNPFVPTEAKLVEGGVKTDGLLDGRLSGTLSVYKIDQKNMLQNFSCTLGTCQSQIGAAQSKGVELETNIRPVDGWQVNFNYAYTDARIKTAVDPIQVGARLTNVAKNSANIWSRYDFQGGALRGLGVGVGVVYTGERTGTLPTTAGTATSTTGPNALILPAYTTMDLALYYLYDRYAFNLKVGNVLDKTYYESAGQTGAVQVAPGAPRNITLSMRVNF